jgi:hypothetical protein
MISNHHKEFLASNTISIWIATANASNVPDTLRCTGLVVEDDTTLRCYIAQKHADVFQQNIAENKNIAFFASQIYNFVTYQYKGSVIEVLPSEPSETELQQQYVHGFTSAMSRFGFPQDKLYDMYFHQPALAIRLKVEKIFEQTPKQNTGGEINI